jgi:Flp pilus assembly protein TadB
MPIGGSLFLIAVGAILKFAVSDRVNGVNLGVVGIILMIVGGIGLIISVVWMSSRRRTEVIERDPAGRRSTTYVQPNDRY